MCIVIFLTGCDYRIDKVDVSKKEESCVEGCKISYSPCIVQETDEGFDKWSLQNCKREYERCVDSCPNIKTSIINSHPL